MTKGWHEIAPTIEKLERQEAAFGLRIVSVATCATHLPATDETGHRVHPGTFGGWHVKEASFDDDSLIAVIGLSDGSAMGLTVGNEVVEVIRG